METLISAHWKHAALSDFYSIGTDKEKKGCHDARGTCEIQIHNRARRLLGVRGVTAGNAKTPSLHRHLHRHHDEESRQWLECDTTESSGTTAPAQARMGHPAKRVHQQTHNWGKNKRTGPDDNKKERSSRAADRIVGLFGCSPCPQGSMGQERTENPTERMEDDGLSERHRSQGESQGSEGRAAGSSKLG
jgi:hypothetical protein